MILGARPVTLTRYEAGDYDANGAWEQGDSEETTIYAAVQPANGKDLLMLPEGDRQKDSISLHTLTTLRVVDHAAGTDADRVTADGVEYEVRAVQTWTDGLPHTRAVAVRLSEVEA
jgi:hypothetical protein